MSDHFQPWTQGKSLDRKWRERLLIVMGEEMTMLQKATSRKIKASQSHCYNWKQNIEFSQMCLDLAFGLEGFADHMSDTRAVPQRLLDGASSPDKTWQSAIYGGSVCKMMARPSRRPCSPSLPSWKTSCSDKEIKGFGTFEAKRFSGFTLPPPSLPRPQTWAADVFTLILLSHRARSAGTRSTALPLRHAADCLSRHSRQNAALFINV